MQDEIAALPGGEHVHRCWQCGSCTNSCTVNAINPDFNPRYWIYLIRLGMESEILRDKDIIWQCVSCNKCTYACPRDVVPEGVMKALSHWMELKGHVPKSPSMVFDEVFSEQVFQRGKIEEGRVMQRFFKRTGQDLRQPWLIEMVKRMLRHLPVTMLTKLGLATVVAPSTSGWSRRAGGDRGIRARAGTQAAPRARARRPDRGGAARCGAGGGRAGGEVMSETRDKYQKVAYYPGCALEGTAHSYNRSTRRSARRSASTSSR